MKKLVCLLICAALSASLASCGNGMDEKLAMEPKTSQMQAICELAVMDCYYHNVAKFKEENAEGIFFWQKDKHFWIEYSGIVSLGIDASQVAVEVEGTVVTIAIPEAKVLRCQVDSDKLSKDSYIVAKDSAKISAEDEVEAFAAAQADLEKAAAADTALLSSARQRAQVLLEEYVNNIGEAMGTDYTIRWVYLGDNDTASQPESASPTSESLNPASDESKE